MLLPPRQARLVPGRIGTLPVLVALVLLAGCSASGSGSAGSAGETDPVVASTPIATLQRAAELRSCPVAGTTRTALPDVRLDCLGGGSSVDVGRLTGPLLVNVWASWCGPCYREMPLLEQLRARADGRVRVLGVDTSDTTSRGLQAALDTKVHYPSVADPHRKVAAALGINTQPTTLFLRADGTIAYTLRTPVTSYAALVALVRQHLGVRL